MLTFQCGEFIMCTVRFNKNKFYVLPTRWVDMFCMDLRTNNDYFPIQN